MMTAGRRSYEQTKNTQNEKAATAHQRLHAHVILKFVGGVTTKRERLSKSDNGETIVENK